MKTRTGIIIVAALMLHFALSIRGAQKAPVEFTSLSVLILPGTAEDPLVGLDWTLGLSSIGNENLLNQELMVGGPEHDFTHESFFVMQGPFDPSPFIFPVVLNIPPLADANENGMDDFYDRSVAVAGIQTLGLHPDGADGAAEFYATWYRDAGETLGVVEIDMPYFDLEFTHIFHLSQYRGEFTYDRTESELQGALALTNVANADDRILGPLTVQVVSTNTLSLSATTWNNGSGMDYPVEMNIFDGLITTNFYSFWQLGDGYLGTTEPDYQPWVMVISSEDADGNGILDLVETNDTPAERPSLSIQKTATGFEITVTGTAGKTYWLEETTRVEDESWPDHQVINLTTATETFTIPAGTAAIRFFRLREV